MKAHFLASFLLLSVVQIGSSPLPQLPGKLNFPGGFTAPGGWVAPSAGWTIPPPPSLPTNVVVAAGESAVGSDLASNAGASDNVTLHVLGYAPVGVSTYLAPTNDMGAGVGSLAASIPGASVESEVAGIDFYGNADDSNDVVLEDMYLVTINTNPTSSASSSIDSLEASSFVSITDGVGLSPVVSGSGWKKDE